MVLRHLPVLLLACAVLAGCSSGPDAPPTATPGPIVVTDPKDLANGSLEGDHLHDYWQGQDRLVLIDEVAPADGSGTAGGASAVFRPGPGAVVPLGTARVEITADWTTAATDVYGEVRLLVKTAADTVPQDVGRLSDGRTFTFDSTNPQNDLPHQLLSAWRFDVVLGAAAGGVYNVQAAPVRLFVEVVRGQQASSTASLGTVTVQGGLRVHVPRDGQTVYPGTKEVVVVLTHTGAVPVTMGLRYHGADTREFVDAPTPTASGTSWTFRIPVSATEADGPYARQSQWEFLPTIEGPVADGPYSGRYALQGSIHRDPSLLGLLLG